MIQDIYDIILLQIELKILQVSEHEIDLNSITDLCPDAFGWVSFSVKC